MDVLAGAPGSRFGVPERQRRPAGIAEGTRWLFAVLAIISLLIALPAALTSQRHEDRELLAVVTASMLVASNVYVYVTRRLPFVLDLCDAVAITGFSLACPDPNLVLGYEFASVWFRSLYDSGWRPLVRCGLYGAALAATVPLWTLMPGHPTAPSTGAIIGILPTSAQRRIGAGWWPRRQPRRRAFCAASTGPWVSRQGIGNRTVSRAPGRRA